MINPFDILRLVRALDLSKDDIARAKQTVSRLLAREGGSIILQLSKGQFLDINVRVVNDTAAQVEELIVDGGLKFHFTDMEPFISH